MKHGLMLHLAPRSFPKRIKKKGKIENGITGRAKKRKEENDDKRDIGAYGSRRRQSGSKYGLQVAT